MTQMTLRHPLSNYCADIMDAIWTSLEGARPSKLKSLNAEDKGNKLKKVLDWMTL